MCIINITIKLTNYTHHLLHYKMKLLTTLDVRISPESQRTRTKWFSRTKFTACYISRAIYFTYSIGSIACYCIARICDIKIFMITNSMLKEINLFCIYHFDKYLPMRHITCLWHGYGPIIIIILCFPE